MNGTINYINFLTGRRCQIRLDIFLKIRLDISLNNVVHLNNPVSDQDILPEFVHLSRTIYAELVYQSHSMYVKIVKW